MQSMSYLIGTWHCTERSTAGNGTETDTITSMGAQWVRYASTMSGMGQPLHTEDGYLGFDSQRRQWVFTSVDTLGGYQVSKSSDSPSAAVQTYTEAYPITPTDGPYIIHKLSDTKYTTDTTWLQNGKKMSAHGVCTKV